MFTADGLKFEWDFNRNKIILKNVELGYRYTGYHTNAISNDPKFNKLWDYEQIDILKRIITEFKNQVSITFINNTYMTILFQVNLSICCEYTGYYTLKLKMEQAGVPMSVANFYAYRVSQFIKDRKRHDEIESLKLANELLLKRIEALEK
jgi:hypothetical protein